MAVFQELVWSFPALYSREEYSTVQKTTTGLGNTMLCFRENMKNFRKACVTSHVLEDT